jgi:NADH dehydrogenase
VEGSEFGHALAKETRAPIDETGRIRVQPDLTIPCHPEIYVIGDLARVEVSGTPLPQLATIASQQGRYVASAIRDRLAGYEPAPFSHVDQGQFALIGRGGVGFLGDTEMIGTSAYLAAKFALGWPGLRAYAAVTGSRT